MLVKAAQAIVPKLPADAPVAGADACCRRRGSSRARPGSSAGPVSLQALYTLGDGDILQLGGKITGAAGDYKDAARRDDAHRRRLPDAGGRRGGLQAPQGQPGHVPEAGQRHRRTAGLPGLREEVRRGHGEREAAGGAAAPDEAAGLIPGLPGSRRSAPAAGQMDDGISPESRVPSPRPEIPAAGGTLPAAGSVLLYVPAICGQRAAVVQSLSNTTIGFPDSSVERRLRRRSEPT